MEQLPQFDEGYHGDNLSLPGSDTGTMTPTSSVNADLKVAILSLSVEARRGLIIMHLKC